MDEIIPLMTMKRREKGEVVELVGKDCCLLRLEEMGILTGAHIRMISPGNPCIILVNETRISLRIDCQTEIFVKKT